MQTILDFDPTPMELHQLGFTELPDDPLTDEIREEILGVHSQDAHLPMISDLMFMRGNHDKGYAYLRRLPSSNQCRIMREEMRAEWSIMDRAA